MTLYYSLIFVILVIEILLFFVLMLPLPIKWQKILIHWWSTSPTVSRIKYFTKISCVFIFILLLDSIARIDIGKEAKNIMNTDEEESNVSAPPSHDMEATMFARKFYAQRNIYLCGSTLFLDLILRRIFFLLKEKIVLTDKIFELQQSLANDDHPTKTSDKKKQPINKKKKKVND
ncbi:B-cell receptor-associated protein 31-like-domain-containing protein [Absidia repens]|uniref:Endoplasmic reticulum transmembrane protein n=1 Tax=Absidia repens TaxID=90262 RepID=A0A1X2IRA6_9FUNG|nr:B-cell receptor-associated protein 31-like-domain-containing protein [Absidia repens]